MCASLKGRNQPHAAALHTLPTSALPSIGYSFVPEWETDV